MTESLSRRHFLRSAIGASLALPWLESLPTFAAAATPAQRIAFFYVPIGVVRRDFFPGEDKTDIPKFNGFHKDKYIGGVNYKIGNNPLQITKTLRPIEKMREHVTFITGLDRTFQTGTDVHAQCASCFMSSAEPYSIKTSAWPLDRTLDQIIADKVGRATPYRSLELSCNSHQDNKESIYFDNISWYGTGHVAPSIRDPRQAYRRLFGTKDAQSVRNITDLVLEDARDLSKELGPSDRHKLSEYFESIRTIEKQMDKLEGMKGELAKVAPDEPPAARLPRGEYIQLMGDLMVVALQSGLTNVATLMVGPERWDTPFTFDGLFDKPKSHHQMSHNQKKHVDELQQVDEFHMAQYAYLIDRMANIKEANGTTLLHNTIFTYGSGLGDGATHQYNKLPIIVAGRGGGKLEAGDRHLHYSEGTPLANLWLAQAKAMGVQAKRFADSTQTLGGLLKT